jgi:hypothetical protein
MRCRGSADSTSPDIIVQAFSQSLGLAQVLRPRPDLSELVQNRPWREMDLKGALQRGLVLR